MELRILSPVSPVAVKKNDQKRMDIDGEDAPAHLVNPGETITTDQQFMRCVLRKDDQSKKNINKSA